MSHIRMILALALIALLGVAGASAAGDLWSDDFEASKKLAAKEGKDLVIDFTGSDWCGWCIKLDKEIFSQEGFKSVAPKNFVLVVVDSPRDKTILTEAKYKENRELISEYGVTGYPTILLTDAQGRPYAKTGYKKTTPAEYAADLVKLQEKRVARDEIFAKADKAKGVEKAKLLDEAMGSVGMKLALTFYKDNVEQIVKLDAKDKAGLKTKYGNELAMAEIDKAMSGRKHKVAIELIGARIEATKAKSKSLQDLLFKRSMAYYAMKDKAAAKADLVAAKEAAPGTPTAKQITSVLDRYFKDEASKPDAPKKAKGAKKGKAKAK